MTTTIDQATKVNIGILGTLLASVIGGTIYLSTLHTNVSHISDTLNEVRLAIEKTNAQLTNDGKTMAVMQTIVQSLERRIAALESSKPR